MNHLTGKRYFAGVVATYIAGAITYKVSTPKASRLNDLNGGHVMVIGLFSLMWPVSIPGSIAACVVYYPTMKFWEL